MKCPNCDGPMGASISDVCHTCLREFLRDDQINKRPDVEHTVVSFEMHPADAHDAMLRAIFEGDTGATDSGVYSPETGRIAWQSERRNYLEQIRIQRLAGSDHKAWKPGQTEGR